MTLLDTNVLIYASKLDSPFRLWARQTIADAVAGDGAAVNAMSIAEICVGDSDPDSVSDRVSRWGIAVLNVPAAAAAPCARAFKAYRERRQVASGEPGSTLPLPDFFIGAHAEIMGWTLATADADRFRTCFPTVVLITP